MDGIHEKLSRIETVSTRQESLKRDVSNINSASKKVLEGTLGPKQLLSVGMCLDPEDENDLPPNSNEITTISSQTQSQKQLLQGTVTLTIVEAKGLKAVDANGLADPYVKVYQTLYGKELILLKTKCVKKSLNPVWNAQMQFIIPPSVVTLELKDKNLFSGSKPLGEIELDMESLFNASNEFDAWLDVGLGGTGSVHVVGKFDSK
ncbi:C2 domain-containing protein [Obelidium mucronatum]|nr:C2 domain-containing protein [Obelidium mucronatum]